MLRKEIFMFVVSNQRIKAEEFSRPNFPWTPGPKVRLRWGPFEGGWYFGHNIHHYAKVVGSIKYVHL